MGVAQTLRVLMDKTGTTNYQLAKAIGAHATSVANWLSGTTTPIKRMQFKIADYFGVTVEYLLGEEEQKEIPTAELGEDSYSDMQLLDAFKSADPVTQELIRRALGLQ